MLKEFQQNRDNWGKQVNRLTREIIEFFLPPICASCGRVGELLCSDCKTQISWLEEPICRQCGRPQPSPTERCHACRNEPALKVQIRAATLYIEPVRSIIHKMKYEGLFGLAEPLAELMVVAWPRWRSPVDLVLPIPLHPDRRRERGYNQSELLVNGVKRHTGWTSDATALQRRRNTRPQLGLSAVERKDNVNGAFWADASKVAGRRILLVDDVCTTGSTLISATESLLEAGATSVVAYCLAMAVNIQ